LPKLLDSQGNETRRIQVVDVNLSEKILPLSTATMMIRADEEDVPERSFVELFTVNGSSGVYRTKNPESGSENTNSVSLEHAICEVGDFLVREKSDSAEKTLAAAIQHYFSFYGGTRWQLGAISATGNVVVSSDYQDILSAILGAIKQIPSAMMTFDFTTRPWTILVRNRDTVVSAEGRMSRNVNKARIRRDDSNLCTRVWLEGLGQDGAMGSMDSDTIGVYGVVEKRLSGNGYTQAQAQTVAAAYLAKYKRPIYSIQIDGEELSAETGESLDRIELGKLYRLTIPRDGITIEETVISRQWRSVYNLPRSVTITLAEEEATAVTFLRQKSEDSKAATDSLRSYMDSGYSSLNSKIVDTQEDVDWIWTKTGINDLGQSETLTTRIQINAEAIQTEVSRATNAENSKISKTSQYASVDSILDRAQALASTAESNAKNASIAKTSTYQSADAIYQAAIRQAATDAGNTYISKTLRYQTADAIVDAAESYVDDQLQSYSTVTQTANAIQAAVNLLEDADENLDAKISLVVTRSGGSNVINTASIVAGINSAAQGGGSYIKLSADTIDIDGVVSMTEARVIQSVSRWLTVETLHVQQNFQFGPDGQEARFGPTNITVGGTTYTVLAVVH
jgi:hypothetical protein